tara:strand:- start:333 stop:806 length:474 start_codon:yes stop_codon:yes gene_type:complete
MIKRLKLPKINLPETWYLKERPGFASKKPGYYSYNVTKQTRELIQSLFPKDFFNENVQIMAQIMNSGVEKVVHKDVSRIYAINYMIHTGGKDAHLGLYNEDKELIDTYNQVPGEWCLLDTQKYHAIRDVVSERTSLTIQFFKIKEEQLEWINAQIRD